VRLFEKRRKNGAFLRKKTEKRSLFEKKDRKTKVPSNRSPSQTSQEMIGVVVVVVVVVVVKQRSRVREIEKDREP
jgi:hypothetical protein